MEEIWRNVENFVGLYKVSNFGRVLSLDRYKISMHQNGTKYKTKVKGRELKRFLSKKGYYKCFLYKEGKRTNIAVHRLVALNFIFNDKNAPCVNHINGIKTDNNIINLEWCDVAHNNKHARDNGLVNIQKGSKIGTSKLKENQVVEIKKMILNEERNVDIAKLFGIGKCTISNIRRGVSWKHIPWPKPEDSN